MRTIRGLTFLLLLSALILSPSTAWAGKALYIDQIRFSPNPTTLTTRQSTNIQVNVSVKGDRRTNFGPSDWPSFALSMANIQYQVIYRIRLRSDIRFWFDKDITTLTITRKARVFPKRDAPEQLWLTITDENNREIVPQTLQEAQSLLFDLNTTIPVKGSLLSEGKHNLYVKVEVELQRDNRRVANDSKDSSRVSLTVKK